jgi:hypothetical protein
MKTFENAKAVMDLLDLRCKLVAEQKEVSELPFSDEAFTEVVRHYGNRGARVAKSMIASSIADEIKEVEKELSRYVCTKFEDMIPVLMKLCETCMTMVFQQRGIKLHEVPNDDRSKLAEYAKSQIMGTIEYIQKEV